MKQKLLWLLAALAFLLPARLSAFNYKYEGVTLRYEVIDEAAKTCKVSGYNDFSGDLVIPDVANDGTIDYSVTSIGDDAFYGCSGLTSVVIPNSVTKIGWDAFHSCFNMTSVVIPNSVTYIGGVAFKSCYCLTSVEIPNSVKTIGERAFASCIGLTSVVIGNSVQTIGDDAFYGCSNKKSAYPITLKNPFENGTAVAYNPGKDIVEDGWVWGPEKSAIYFAPLNLEGEYTIPESVTEIGWSAFEGCSGLTSVEIPNSVKTIGSAAFYGCSGLTSVAIPESVTYIGNAAFWDSSLISLTFNAENCTAIGSWEHPAFPSCLKTVVFGDKVTKIPAYSFRRCEKLTSVVIPNSVTEIGSSAFDDCRGLIKSAYPNTLKNPFNNGVTVGYNPDGAIFEDGWVWGPEKSAIYFAPLNLKGEYQIPETVTSIGEYAFYGCSGLTSVVIPESVTSIGDHAFYGCSGLTSVVIPNSVISIGSYAFYDCRGLMKSAYPNTLRNPFGNGITVAYNPDGAIIENGWVWGSNKSVIYFVPLDFEGDYTIPESVTSIGNSTFRGCSGLTSVVIPEYVTSIGDRAFNGCSGLTSLEFNAENCKANGSSEYPVFPSSLETVVFGDKVTKIPDYSFYGCKKLTSVVIPNSVTSIGTYAFEGCSGMTSLEFNAENCTAIGSKEYPVFPSSLETVVFGNKVTKIPDYSFYGCKKLTSVEIPNSVTEIGSAAFNNCSALASVVIGNSVTEIGSAAFNNCSALASVVIGNSVTSIGEKAFNGCSGLTSVVIGNSVQTIGGLAFYGCSGLTSVVIPNSVQTIDDWAFESCSGLTSVVIGNSVTSIGKDPFKGCKSLIKSAYPNTLEKPFEYGNCISYNPEGAIIEDGWIWGPEKTEIRFVPYDLEGDYTIPESVKSIGTGAFYRCSGLTSVEIPESVTSIGDSAFSGCRRLTSVDIPNSVTSIGSSAFRDCSGLTSVTAVSVSPADMDDNSFEGLYDTVKLTVPDEAINNYLATSWSLFKNIQNNSGMELGSFSDGVLEYRLNPTDMTAMVIGAKSYSDLQIPERFTDDSDAANPVRYYIKGIGYKAFYDKGVNSVEFNSRSQMEYIGDYAFANTKISSIALPETMKTIGNYAFAQTNISSISIPGSVVSIEDYAFYNTSKLSNVDLKEGLESIGRYTFSAKDTRSVTGKPLYLPSTVKSIGKHAFQNFVCSQVDISNLSAWYGIDFGSYLANPLCGTSNGLYVDGKKLTSLNVPEDIKEIKPYSFYNCKSLEEVTFPEGLEKIGTNSFHSCSNVAEVTIPASVVEIGRYVFGQTNVTFADGLLPISFGEEAFYNVEDLYFGRPVEGLSFSLGKVSTLKIGNLITEIPEGKFKNLKELKTLSLGNSVEAIGNEAFSGCSKLTNLKFASELQTVGDEAFSGCTSLAEVILPPSVETIGASAFAGDSNLASIIMGHKVKTIGEKAFDGCKANTVSITAQTPPTAPNNTFSNYTGKLYVQGEKAKDAYYDAFTCWDRFDSYVMIDAEEIKVEGADKISGKAGDTFQLTATVWPENVTLPQIFWRSTNPEIATVDENGLVTLHVDLESLKTRAQGEGDIDGVCTIIAETLYNDGPIAQVGVTAEDTPILAESITLSQESWSAHAGETVKLTAMVLPEDTTDKTVTWTSSNDAVATVDAEGNVTAVAVGEADITATCGSVSASCKVTVTPILAESITLSQESWSANAGETVKLTATVLPEDTTDKTVIWTSSNDAVATVDAEGNVTAVAVGEADITATCGSVSASCKVTVLPILVESLTIDPTVWSGEEGSEFKITATVLPENASDKALAFESSDTSVATVDDEGNVKVLKEGTCVITVSTVDGSNLTAECVVTGLSGVEAIFADPDAMVDVYDMNGVMLKKDCSREELKQLKPAVYILRSGDTVVKAVVK